MVWSIQYSSFDLINFSHGERCSDVYIYLPQLRILHDWFVASDQLRELSLLRRRHKDQAILQCTDEAQNKAETRVCTKLAPCKNHFFMTQLADGFAAKGLFILMTSGSVATGLALSILII